jgi:hypothetical protein
MPGRRQPRVPADPPRKPFLMRCVERWKIIVGGAVGLGAIFGVIISAPKANEVAEPWYYVSRGAFRVAMEMQQKEYNRAFARRDARDLEKQLNDLEATEIILQGEQLNLHRELQATTDPRLRDLIQDRLVRSSKQLAKNQGLQKSVGQELENLRNLLK